MEPTRAEWITSFKNPRIQYIRDLLNSHKSRMENHACVVEGVRLAEEVLRSGNTIQCAVFSEGISSRGLELVNDIGKTTIPLIKVPDELMNKISATEAGQGLLLIVEPNESGMTDQIEFVLILDEIKDPGNMGTLLRTAAAAGVQSVIITPGCVDAWSPKVLRAGMGAHFRIPLRMMGWDEIIKLWRVQTKSPALYLAESAQGQSVWDVDMAQPLGLIIGGEANGASDSARSNATGYVTIPMPGGSESLNAAVAAGILLFEVVRQRSA